MAIDERQQLYRARQPENMLTVRCARGTVQP
jgi:hypothetical protein